MVIEVATIPTSGEKLKNSKNGQKEVNVGISLQRKNSNYNINPN